MNRPTLTILCGLPGCGKSTYAHKKAAPDDVILSSDSIREELYGAESIQGDPSEVFFIMQQRAVEALMSGKNVFYDATNLTRKDRSGIIKACPSFVQITCTIVWATLWTCVERDKQRARVVGEDVITKMLKRFQMPYYDEGIEKINIVNESFCDLNSASASRFYQEYSERLRKNMNIPHDNKHHQFNILQHCEQAMLYAINHNFNASVRQAAFLHDCGKPYVKSFENTRGEITEEAHYYQHQCVSAWYACGIMPIDIDALWLISTHMDPFMNTKYYHALPKFLKDLVDQLHECDLNAH